MPTPILMPKLSDDMREGKILAWKKSEGDAVESGEVIAEVETDKANLEIEAYSAGRLAKIVAPVGATVPCGQPIAILAEEGEEIGAMHAPAAAPKPPASKEAAPRIAAPAESQPAAAATISGPARSGADWATRQSPPQPAAPKSEQPSRAAAFGSDRVRASPLARRMARDGNLDLRALQGSGPGGRVVKADVERALASAPRPVPELTLVGRGAPAKDWPAPRPPPALREETLPLSGMRKAIARRMSEAKPGAPHFYLTIDVEMTKALELRRQINEQLAQEWGSQISVNDLVLRAAALALLRRPEVNASFGGESVKRHGTVHLGFALAVEDGLLTPVIRDADKKSLAQISREARELAERGRARKLRPEEYQGSTFTVSNLGMYGVKEFSAIINPGEAAILAVGAVEKRPVVVGDQIEVGQVMSATLSGDHRVIDGALGAQLLKEFRAILEQPLRLLA